MKLDDLKSDLRREADGEWIECPELGSGVALKVRGLDYAPFRTALRLAQLRFARLYPGEKLPPPDDEDAKNGELYADHLLVGWRGLEPAHTPEVARAALVDVAHRKLRLAVAACARQVGEAAADQTRLVEGNSAPASDGN